MAWLSNWGYRKKITISGSSDAGTNYQVLLKIGESSGASDYDFHLEGHSASFPSNTNQGGDLRFTSSDGSTLLDFWVESVTGSSPNRVAYVWVEVADDLGSNVDIYCYYGNSSASNYSNGFNTFVLFDDFEDGNYSGWTTYESRSNATVSIESSSPLSGTYSVKTSVIYNTYAGIYKDLSTSTSNYAIRVLTKYDYYAYYDTNSGIGFVIRYRLSDNTPKKGVGWVIVGEATGSDWQGGASYIKETSGWSSTSPNTIISGELKLYSYPPSSYDQIRIESRHQNIDDGSNYHYHWIDNILLRKCISTEPSFYSAGSEELPIKNTGNFFLFF